MTNSKENVARFFEQDSADYLQHKYTGEKADSFMALRRACASQLIRDYIVPATSAPIRFLDVGCGPGILLTVLGEYAAEYCGIDISEEMLTLGRQGLRAQTSERFSGRFLKGDVEQLPFEANTFDVAASLGVIEYLDGDDLLLAEMTRVTVPSGFVLIAVTNKYSYNLLFEKIIIWLRKRRVTLRMLSYFKKMLGRGEFKPMDFVMRRHSPTQFVRQLRERGFEIVALRSWGFNLLPYPFNVFCGRGVNRFANRVYDRSTFKPLRMIGEGFMVLCRRSGTGSV